LAVDLEKVGGFVEDVSEGLVIHELKINKIAQQGQHPRNRELLDLSTPGAVDARRAGESRWAGQRYAALVTFAACGPFWPSVISNST
jgi:hypothetical protein